MTNKQIQQQLKALCIQLIEQSEQVPANIMQLPEERKEKVSEAIATLTEMLVTPSNNQYEDVLQEAITQFEQKKSQNALQQMAEVYKQQNAYEDALYYELMANKVATYERIQQTHRLLKDYPAEWASYITEMNQQLVNPTLQPKWYKQLLQENTLLYNEYKEQKNESFIGETNTVEKPLEQVQTVETSKAQNTDTMHMHDPFSQPMAPEQVMAFIAQQEAQYEEVDFNTWELTTEQSGMGQKTKQQNANIEQEEGYDFIEKMYFTEIYDENDE